MGMENPFDIAGEPDLTDSVITCVGCSCACVCHVHIRVFKMLGVGEYIYYILVSNVS